MLYYLPFRSWRRLPKVEGPETLHGVNYCRTWMLPAHVYEVFLSASDIGKINQSKDRG
jgi:hypothetical protein